MDVALIQNTEDFAAGWAQNLTTLKVLNTEMDVHRGRRSTPAKGLHDDSIEKTSNASSEAADEALSSKGRNRRNFTSPKTIQ